MKVNRRALIWNSMKTALISALPVKSLAADALDHLEKSRMPLTLDEVQKDLLKEKKEVLMAEAIACGSLFGETKTKCKKLNGDL